MDKHPKKVLRLESQPDFEEIDARLAAGWYVSTHDSGQRKRYLKSIKSDSRGVA